HAAMRGTLDPRFRLLHGPYQAPPLRRGDRATCLLRDGDVVITGWSDARISWPRCRAVGTRGGGSGLLLDEELARAVRHESAAAIGYWWGVSEGVVWRGRQALGVTRTNNGGGVFRGRARRAPGRPGGGRRPGPGVGHSQRAAGRTGQLV